MGGLVERPASARRPRVSPAGGVRGRPPTRAGRGRGVTFGTEFFERCRTRTSPPPRVLGAPRAGGRRAGWSDPRPPRYTGRRKGPARPTDAREVLSTPD